MDGQFLEMGRAGKAHGIKGELGLTWNADFPLAKNSIVYLKKEGFTPYTVESLRYHNNKPLVRLRGVNDRTRAESLQGAVLYMAKKDLPPLEQDEFFVADLAGRDVYLADGERLGILDHVEFPANLPVWVIKEANGVEILFPANDQFIVSMDHNRIVIDPPEGLLEVYRA